MIHLPRHAVHRALKKCITCTMEVGHVLVSPPQMERGSAFFGLARTSMRCVLRLLLVSQLQLSSVCPLLLLPPGSRTPLGCAAHIPRGFLVSYQCKKVE